ncbi:acyl carrier protein [Microbispora sp. CA-135349]|uniref:acyl carrier protein n=1 Tax=Microbispora sp. CA-135349 TaxID=3239953 RepID=UPI003D921808
MTDRACAPEVEFDLDGTPAEVVRAVWADALGVATIEPDVGFFDLGATSAMILGVVRVLRRRWPGLKVVDVFSHPTVAQLAALLDDE